MESGGSGVTFGAWKQPRILEIRDVLEMYEISFKVKQLLHCFRVKIIVIIYDYLVQNLLFSSYVM